MNTSRSPAHDPLVPVIVRTGDGPKAWVGFHGWGGSRATWTPILPWLPEDASLHAVELPGFGATPGLATWSVDALRASVIAAIDAIPHERFTLVGNCSGAIFGLLGAMERPHRIERVVLIDPFAYVPWYFRLFVLPGVGRLFYASTFANPVGRWITNAGLRRHRTGRTDLTQPFQKVDHRSAWHTLRLLAELRTVEPFAPLHRPTTIVHGARTFHAVRRSIALWRAMWPHVDVRSLPSAGHLPIQEASEEVASLVFADPASRDAHGQGAA
jgi:pimeloyl-ACP methyl ester carboxylesterase